MKYIVILSLILISVISSCKKEKAKTESNYKGDLHFHIHSFAGENEMSYDSTYIINGRAFKFEIAQLYISNIQLIKPDGSLVNVEGKRLLKTLENEDYDLGEVPAGNYSGMKFLVGFNTQDNALLPQNSNDSLILKDTKMWMSNQVQPDGYAFIRLKGEVDTSSNKNGLLVPFDYKIGTINNGVTIHFENEPMIIEASKEFYCHFYIDYHKLFSSLTLNNSSNLFVKDVSDNSGQAAMKIINNVPEIFIK